MSAPTGALLDANQVLAAIYDPATGVIKVENVASGSIGTVNQGVPNTATNAWPVRLVDATTSNEVALFQSHNADNQALGGGYAINTGGVAQLLNGVGGIDRQRETVSDNVPNAGIASGASQMASGFSTTVAATIASGVRTVTPAAMSGTNNGSLWTIQVGHSLVVDVGAAQEVVFVTATTPTTFTANFANAHTGPWNVVGYVYNQAKDATLGDNSLPAGIPAGAQYVINPAGTYDRQRATGQDNIPAQGVVSGTQQLVSPITISGGGTVSAGATSVTITPASQLKQTVRGASAWVQAGSVLTFEPGTANQESVIVSAVNYGTGVLTIRGLGNGGGNTGFQFGHTAAYSITSYSYNQARDATLPDGSTGQGVGAGATFLFNTSYNGGAGGWEAERSFAGELNGATGVGSAIATEYEDTSGGPVLASGLASGLRLQAAVNLTGKGRQTQAITSTTAGNTSIVFSSAAATNLVLAGHPIILTGSGTQETVYTSSSWTPGSSATVPLQSPVVNTGQTLAAFDINASNGPGLSGFTPNGVGIEEEALYNPVDGLYYVERSATQDGAPGANVVLESAALWNGSSFDRERNAKGDSFGTALGDARTPGDQGCESEVSYMYGYNGTSWDRLKSTGGQLQILNSYLSVVAFLDTNPVLNAASTNIPASTSSPLQVVASLGAACKKVKLNDTTGNYVGVYTGGAGSEVLKFIIVPGTDSDLEHAIPAGTRISVRNMANTAITSGNICIQFLG